MYFWSNKKDLNQKSHRSSESERNWRIFCVFGEKLSSLHQKPQEKVRISLVFWTPVRYLIQIFFIRPEIHCSLRKYMISLHYSSLLAFFSHCHFLDCYDQKIPEMIRKWRVRTSNDEDWREIKFIRKQKRISSPIKNVWIKNVVGLRKWIF